MFCCNDFLDLFYGLSLSDFYDELRLNQQTITNIQNAISSCLAYNKYYMQLSQHCLQCFDAVGWAAGRPSGL